MPILESQLRLKQNAIAIETDFDADDIWDESDPVTALRWVGDHRPGEPLAWNDPFCKGLRAVLAGQASGSSFSIAVDWDEDLVWNIWDFDLMKTYSCHGTDLSFPVDPLVVTFTAVPEGGYLVTGYHLVREPLRRYPLAYQQVDLSVTHAVTYYFDGASIYAYSDQGNGRVEYENAVFVGNKNEKYPGRGANKYDMLASTPGFIGCAEAAASALTPAQQAVVKGFYGVADQSWRELLAQFESLHK